MTAQPQHHHDQPELTSYAKQNLDDAIDQLVGTRTGTINGQTRVRESRYQEIRDNVGGAQGTQNRQIARSLPPLWIDGADFLAKVDSTVKDWVPDNRSKTSTPDRLYSLTSLTWRPQDVQQITHWAETLLRFTAQADQLLDPDEQHRWELVASCPACSTKTVHRKDTAGEYVRQAALVITAQGCVCQQCKTTWTPDYFQHLARVIGCPEIDGISTGVAGEIR